MSAYGTNFGCFNADSDMSTVSAFPNGNARLFENFHFFNVLKKRSISFFVSFFDCGNASKLRCKFGKSFLFSILSHSVVHIRPLVVFALCRVLKVGGNVTEFAKRLKPKFSVFFLVVGGFEEDSSDLLESCFLCNGC